MAEFGPKGSREAGRSGSFQGKGEAASVPTRAIDTGSGITTSVEGIRTPTDVKEPRTGTQLADRTAYRSLVGYFQNNTRQISHTTFAYEGRYDSDGEEGISHFISGPFIHAKRTTSKGEVDGIAHVSASTDHKLPPGKVDSGEFDLAAFREQLINEENPPENPTKIHLNFVDQTSRQRFRRYSFGRTVEDGHARYEGTLSTGFVGSPKADETHDLTPLDRNEFEDLMEQVALRTQRHDVYSLDKILEEKPASQ